MSKSFLTTGGTKTSPDEMVSKWDKLGFLDGLKGHVKEDIAQLYCCKASHLLEEPEEIDLNSRKLKKLKK